MIKKLIFTLFLFVISSITFAQEAQNSVEMATGLHQSGKIYVVVVVLSVIFLGIIGYLIILDRKVGKLEKEFGKKNNS